MLLRLEQFGGLAPRILDPVLLPANRSQISKNCRFDKGGVVALNEDTSVGYGTIYPPPESIYVYYLDGVKYFFQWDTDVDVVKGALAGDSFSRIFYTENGEIGRAHV
jgi:hypothetical protein